MTPVLLDALLGLFSFAGLATLAVSRHQAEWRAVSRALGRGRGRTEEAGAGPSAVASA